MFGGLDLQVDAGQNAGPMEEALVAGGNEDVTVVTFENANHLFQEAGTGAFEEYAALEPAFVDGFLTTISDWILERTTSQ